MNGEIRDRNQNLSEFIGWSYLSMEFHIFFRAAVQILREINKADRSDRMRRSHIKDSLKISNYFSSLNIYIIFRRTNRSEANSFNFHKLFRFIYEDLYDLLSLCVDNRKEIYETEKSDWIRRSRLKIFRGFELFLFLWLWLSTRQFDRYLNPGQKSKIFQIL